MTTSRTGTTVYLNRRARFLAKARREGWPCALCGKPIDYSLKRPHPGAFQLDHITPYSRGGADLDPANWQPSHASCNRAKSDSVDMPTLKERPDYPHTVDTGGRVNRLTREW
ncbi:HNH endonuclease [Promicromonospora sp. NFX87]|uniref:HNH endonuclease n=1 Tax=Promicromonospora sp. NFX87 TaxID=3402691 RepID=UPI003AFABB31